MFGNDYAYARSESCIDALRNNGDGLKKEGICSWSSMFHSIKMHKAARMQQGSNYSPVQGDLGLRCSRCCSIRHLEFFVFAKALSQNKPERDQTSLCTKLALVLGPLAEATLSCRLSRYPAARAKTSRLAEHPTSGLRTSHCSQINRTNTRDSSKYEAHIPPDGGP